MTIIALSFLLFLSVLHVYLHWQGYNDDENIKEDEIISAKKVIQKTEPIEYRMEYTEDEMKQIQLQQQMFENTPLPGDKNVDKLMKSM